MSLAESDRNLLYRAFAEHFDENVTQLVMELLFTPPTDNLVTQADLHANTALLNAESAALRSELKGEMAELRGEMSALRSELKGEMAEVRGEFKAEVGNLYRWGAVVVGANAVAMITALLT